MVVLVTGANGQLGQALQFISGNYPEMNFVFCDSAALDITNLENCETVFQEHQPNFCINAAAYTAVDKAESEPQIAFDVNANGPENLAITCKKHNTVLLHVSTDFVFDFQQLIKQLRTVHKLVILGEYLRQHLKLHPVAHEPTWLVHVHHIDNASRAKPLL